MLDILVSDRARDGLRRGLQVTAAAVAATFGPCGRPVVVGDPKAPLRVARTGLAVAMSMHFEDPAETAGAALLRQVADWAQEAAGDGTAGAVLVAQVLARECVGMVGLGFHPTALRRGVDAALAEAERHVAGLARPVTGDAEAMGRVAATAAGDDGLGRLVADAAGRAGNGGLVVVEEGPEGGAPHVDLVEGVAIGAGFASPDLVTLRGRACERRRLHRPLVLLARGRIERPEALLPALEHARRSRRPVLVVAEGASAPVVASLLPAERRDAAARPLMVELASCGANGTLLDDLAGLTGATVAGRRGEALGVVSAADLGDAATVLADAGRTIVVGFRSRAGPPESALAVLRAGSRGGEEAADLRVRAERAARAVHGASLHGAVPGGGVALLSAARALAERGAAARDRYDRLGHSLAQRALEEPFRQALRNAGIAPARVMRRLLDRDDPERAGVSLPSGAVVDLAAAGILDPLPTIRAVLCAAASGIRLLLATEAAAAGGRSTARDGEERQWAG